MATISAQGSSPEETLRAVSAAVLAVASEPKLDIVLHRLADAARELVGARYAAIGVPDGDGGFEKFVSSGMSEAQLEALGELPRTHGLLGVMLEHPEPFRTDDIQRDPRFEGWPPAHPNMHSFLGVPLVWQGEIVGALYLTEKQGRRRGSFTDEDTELAVLLAAHAAVAVANARLHEEGRELAIVEERKRLARELHDSVVQTMHGVVLVAEGAARQSEGDPELATAALRDVAALTRNALADMRSLLFELRPAALEQDGLAEALRKHADVLVRVHGVPVAVECEGDHRLEPAAEQTLFRIVQEALGNAVRHSGCGSVQVALALAPERACVVVRDDGGGFDVELARTRSGRLGLVSMRERAEAIGAILEIESGASGTRVSVELPAG